MAIENENIDSPNDEEIDYSDEEIEEEETETENQDPEGEEEQEEESGSDEKTDEIDYKALYEAEKQKRKELYKKNQLKKAKPNQTNNGLSKTDVEELLLRDKGIDDDSIEILRKLQKVAKLDGKEISLAEAQKDPLFISHKEKLEREERRRKAQIGNSSGGGDTQAKPITDEEHQALVMKRSKELLRKNFG